MLPTLKYETLQCGFVPGGLAANGVYLLNRAAELSCEWKVPLYVAQLDLRKAFDQVKHSAVLDGLKMQGVSLQCLAVLCMLLKQSTAILTMANVRGEPLRLQRGLPQGAPESPLLFTIVTEFVLRPLLRQWRSLGYEWCCDGFCLSALCYADDIILVSSSKKHLEKMVAQTLEAFADVGLAVSTEKCHWSSCPTKPQSRLKFGADRLCWEPTFTFVGSVIAFCGNDGPAINYRLAQATKVYFRWKDVLQCKSVCKRLRILLTIRTVFSALLWLSETWTPTAAQRKKLESWGARTIARVVRVNRYPDEDGIQHWRRLHRTGHAVLASYGGIEVQRRRRLHGFAGHVARLPEGLLYTALRTRSLSWWRAFQSRRLVKHPRRFSPWRWEQQLENFFGVARSIFVDEDVGWRAFAQDRVRWRSCRDTFAKSAGNDE